MSGTNSSDFSNASALRVFPRLGDPSYALRRYMCLQPRLPVQIAAPPPILAGEFVPILGDEILILSEPWEDIPNVGS